MESDLVKSTNKARVHDYIDRVLGGVLVTGTLEQAACQRHLDDLKNGKKRGLYFDEAAADAACDFFPLLEHTTGAYDGQPFILADYELFCTWSLFGWKRKVDNWRRFRIAFISVGRGNGKSPFAAGLILLGLAFDKEARADCYPVATKRGQARIVFEEAKRFVSRSSFLRKLIVAHEDNLSVPANFSTLAPLSSEGKTADGLIPHFVIRDELHAWRPQHRELSQKITTGMGKRDQPLDITITTAGSEESELWLEEYEMSRLVVERDNKVEADDRFVFICEIDDDDSELDESVWPKANPLMADGVVKIDHMRSLAAKAKIIRATRAELRRYHCNKLTRTYGKSIDAETWAKGNEELPELDGLPCYSGADLGWKDDLAAVGYCFPIDRMIDGENKPMYVIDADVWCPRGGNRDLTIEPWAGWIEDGLLRCTDSEWTDVDAIYARINERIDLHGIRSLAYDPNNAREFALNCTNKIGIEVYGFAQTHDKYNEALREFMIVLNEGRIIHGGNPLLAWCASNMVEEENSKGSRMPSKKRSREKIDPIVAIIMALSEAMFDEKNRVSYYDTHALEMG